MSSSSLTTLIVLITLIHVAAFVVMIVIRVRRNEVEGTTGNSELIKPCAPCAATRLRTVATTGSTQTSTATRTRAVPIPQIWPTTSRSARPADPPRWRPGRDNRSSRRRCIYPDVVRLVSLLPSATEIIYALGLGDQLVGVTFECDEPPQARQDKTVVVGGRDTRGMTPGEIDSYVRAQTAAGNDLYTLHTRALADLKPELILTQDLCRVCALPSGQVADALNYLGCQADVLSLDPHSLEDVLDSIQDVGRRAECPTEPGS